MLLTSKITRKNQKWPRNSSLYEQERKWLSKFKLNLFFICGSELLNLLLVHDLGAETNISDVYCSSCDLYFIVKSKMYVILVIYY